MSKPGRITYDSEFGHVCTCSYIAETEEYRLTVHVDPSVEPTEGGSWWYVCDACGAGAWSGL
jgi:hypothetical protein